MLRRVLVLLAVLLVASGVTAAAAGASTAPTGSASTTEGPDTPGMLLPHGRSTPLAPEARVAQKQKFVQGDCELLDGDGSVKHCKPSNPPAISCTGYTSQTTPPSTIRVLVRTSETTYRIDTVNFKTYVEDVLPNEWNATWDGDAVKTGLVAIKSYAWYWVTHYGGYTGSSATSSSCFDVTDDSDFQNYVAGSGSTDPTTVARNNITWPVAIRVDGQIVQSEYQDHLSASESTETCGYHAGGTITSRLSQDGSEACNKVNDYNNGYRYNVILKLYYGNSIDLSTTPQLRTQHDFNFTARSTGGTWTASRWYIADGYPTSFRFGLTGDLPFTATNGDGFALAAVWRPSTKTFYLADALHNVAATVPFGLAGDVPVAAHYQGLDAATQLAVWRPGNGTWYLAGPSGGTASTTQYGLNGDIPVPGRWLSATTDSFAVWRPSAGNWYIRGGATVQWGLRGDIPAPADYNGDGKTDIAVYRPGNNTFYVRGANPVGWGLKGDVPVSGDFNGDGRADFAVYRPSNGIIYVNGQASINASKGTPIGLAPVRG